MGKVNLNKKNKSEKDATFKKKKVLGKGKHQHLSHTKIDLETATLKVPTQSRYENVEKEPQGPTMQQMLDLITLCHSDNEKKVKNALDSFLSFLPRAPDLFLQKISEVLAATLHHLRSPDPKIRESAKKLISWIFGRYARQCSPFIPVFIRHIGAIVANSSPIIKMQSAFLLEKISTLPNLQPLPSLFELFPKMVSYSTTPNDFSQFSKIITQILSKFSEKTSSNQNYHSFEDFQFPQLFPDNSVTFAQRFTSKCAFESSEIESIQNLVDSLQHSFQLISGESDSLAVSDLCGLLLAINNLQLDINFDPFFEFVGSKFPYEEGSTKSNVNISKFLIHNKSFHPKIKEFLSSIPTSIDNIVLFATIGDFSSEIAQFPELSSCIPELCKASISDEAAPFVADAILQSIITEETITKRSIRALISISKKNDDFQQKLIQCLISRLPSSSLAIADLFLILISSSAPLNRQFLKDFSIFISNDSEIDEELCKKCVDSVAITNTSTDCVALLCFLMTVGSRRVSMRQFCKNHISRLHILADNDSKPFFSHLDLDNWAIL